MAANDARHESKMAAEKNDERRLRRWDPFDMFDDLQEEMTRLWGQAWPFVPRPLSRPLRRLSLAPTTWSPSLDIYQKGGDLVVKAELPGMKKEDIDVALDQGDLIIRGERQADSDVREEHYYRVERSYGSFYRRIPLPFEARAEQITANYNDGVLEVRIPRPVQGQPQPHKITLT